MPVHHAFQQRANHLALAEPLQTFTSLVLCPGVYSLTAEGVQAFSADIHHICDLFTAASKRPQSDFAASLSSCHAPAVASLVTSHLDDLVGEHLTEEALTKDMEDYRQLQERLAKKADAARYGHEDMAMADADEAAANGDAKDDGGHTGPKAMQRWAPSGILNF